MAQMLVLPCCRDWGLGLIALGSSITEPLAQASSLGPLGGMYMGSTWA